MCAVADAVPRAAEAGPATRKTSVSDVMRRLLQPQNMLVSLPVQKSGVYLAIVNIIQGDVRNARVCVARVFVI